MTVDVRHVLLRREMDPQRASQEQWQRLERRKAEAGVEEKDRGIFLASVMSQNFRTLSVVINVTTHHTMIVGTKLGE
jgi:hypothetical protein